MASVLSECFLAIYQNLFLTESTEIYEKCIEFVLERTKRSLRDHLKSDIEVNCLYIMLSIYDIKIIFL